MTLEGPGRGELSELVPNHRFGHENRDVLAAVMHADGVPDHVGGDHGATRPGLNDVVCARLVLGSDLLGQMLVDEGALLQTAWHVSDSQSALLAGLAATHDETAARLFLVTGATLGLTPRAHWVTTAGGTALATTVRVVDRVHDHTANGRANALPAVTASLTPVDVDLLGITDLTDGGASANVDHAHLT